MFVFHGFLQDKRDVTCSINGQPILTAAGMADDELITQSIFENACVEQRPRKLLFGGRRHHLSNLDHLLPAWTEYQLNHTTHKAPFPAINLA